MERDRRKMKAKAGLEARNSQAAKDALRRRQKIKKARTVKRHVRYKQKKKLLEELTKTESNNVIVADNLSNPFAASDDEAIKPQSNPVDKKPDDADSLSVEVEPELKPQELEDMKQDKNEEIVKAEEPVKKKKHMPFEKERKHFEQVKKEREKEQEERKMQIETQQNMRKESKKQRKAKVS